MDSPWLEASQAAIGGNGRVSSLISPTPPRLVRRSAVVGIGTLASRLTGLVRVVVTAAVLGDTLLADTYNKSNVAPNIVFELLLGGVLTASLLPVFVAADEDGDSTATAAVFTAALLLLGALTALAMLLAPAIGWLFSHNVDGAASRSDAQYVGTVLVRLFMPQMLFYGFTALATAALNARRKFVAAAFAPVLNNIVVIALLVTLHRQIPRCPQSSVDCAIHYAAHHTAFTYSLGVGTTLGIAAMALALFVPLRRLSGAMFTRNNPFRHTAVRRMAKLSGWTLGYVAANQLALVYVVTRAHTGDYVHYLYAFTFFQLPHGLLAVSIMTGVMPELATAVKRGDTRGLQQQFVTGLRYLLLVMIPAAGMYLALSPGIIEVLRHGKFQSGAVVATAHALTGFAWGLVPFSVYLYLLRVFYAHGNTRTPFVINCAENACNIVLAWVLYPRFGIGGLALAYSLSYVIAAIVTLVFVRRVTGTFPIPPLATMVLRVGGAATIASLIAWRIAAPDPQGIARSGIAGCIGIAVYLGITRVFAIPEISGAFSAVTKRRHTKV